MARGWSREISLGCLLHDASEAYLSDVTRPVKKDLAYYLKVEDRLQNMIWKLFIGRPITEAERQSIFEIDDQMLSMEFHQIMSEELNTDYEKLIRSFKCCYKRQEDVEKEFVLLEKELEKQ